MTGETPFLDFFKRGEAPRDARLLAAQGRLAPRAQEQLSLLVMLLEDGDQEIRLTAEDTLNRIPAEALARFLARADVPIGLREFFADRGVFPDEIPNLAPDAEDAPLIVSGDEPEAEAPGGAPADGEADPDAPEGTLIQRLAGMSFTQRLKAAVNGTREMRAILIRDSNRMIAAAVLSSPKLSEPEVESICKMGSVSEDVLRTIAHRRSWMKNYNIVLALVKNSKTPVGVSMHLIPRLHGRDLNLLSIDRNVPEPLRVAARRKVVESTSKK